MPKELPYLEEFIPHLYKRKTIDIMVFVFIDTYQFVHPSVTIKDAALAFLKRYKISEDLFCLKSITQSYERTKKDYYDAERKHGQEQREG